MSHHDDVVMAGLRQRIAELERQLQILYDEHRAIEQLVKDAQPEDATDDGTLLGAVLVVCGRLKAVERQLAEERKNKAAGWDYGKTT